MRLTLAYSQSDEGEALEKVFSQGDEIRVELVKVSEDKLKFEVKDFDMAYISPIMLFQDNFKFLTSLVKVENKLTAIKTFNGQYSVRSTSSIEYCLLRAKRAKIILNFVEGEEEDLTNLWKETCGDLPPVVKVLASVRLSDDEMRRIKAFIRKRLNSVNIPENFIKELGKFTEKFIQCVKNLCESTGLPLLGSPVPF